MMTDSLLTDVRYALRRLASTPGFTLAAALCLAVGVGANATIFSLVDAILLRPLAGVTAPDELIEVGRSQDGDGSDTFGYPTLVSLAESSRTAEIAGWTFAPLAIGGDGEPVATMGLQVTANYFDVLGVPMQAGRGLSAEEADAVDGASVIVLSDGLWRGRFGADPAIVGREIRVNGTSARVIGVTAPGFAGTIRVLRADAWVPFGMRAGGLASAEALESWQNNFVLGVARRRPEANLVAVGDELETLMTALVGAHPDALHGQGVVVNQLGGLPVDLTAAMQLFMAVLMAVVALVLAVACVNVAGMLLARSMARSREVAIRAALGAARGRIARQLMTESVVMVALGGLLGIALSAVATRLLAAIELPVPPPFDVAVSPSFDLRVFAFAILATAVASVAAGLGPAWRASRADLVPALKSGARSGQARGWGRSVLIAGQTGITIVLLVTAGLFLRALDHAASIDLGFQPDGVYAMSLDTDLTGLGRAEANALLDGLSASVRQVSGVRNASASALLPLGLPSNMGFGGLQVAGFEPPAGESSYRADVNIVGDAYFETMGIPLLAGSDFAANEDPDGPAVALINRHMADFFWRGGNAVGQTFTLGGTQYTVKGVAADAKYQTLTEDPRFFVYVPHEQQFRAQTYLIARIDGPPARALAAIRERSTRLAPDLPVLQVVSLRSYAELGLLPQRVAAIVAGAMGVVVIILATVGIYGVTAQMARRRVREIGVRMALGAGRADVQRMVIRDGMRAPLVGLVGGLGLAALATRVLASFLYGVSPLDPAVFGLGALLLAAITLFANWAPARWAARVDPMRALRAE